MLWFLLMKETGQIYLFIYLYTLIINVTLALKLLDYTRTLYIIGLFKL